MGEQEIVAHSGKVRGVGEVEKDFGEGETDIFQVELDGDMIKEV
jgi:hypothetical protein